VKKLLTATARLAVGGLGSLLIAGMPALASANTLYATNTGVDSATCGFTSDHACRSISQAMDNASSGDTIMVGAGRYGDLSGDGNFDSPGSEHATSFSYPLTGGCVVCILKPLKIYSYSGTAATVIEGNVGFNAVVSILSDKVVFGSKDHGFTLTGSGSSGTGLLIDYGVNGTLKTSVRVEGNVALNDGEGFVVVGPLYYPHGCPEEFCSISARVVFSQNSAIADGVGFDIEPHLDTGASPIVLQDNLALGTGTGFVLNPADADPEDSQPNPCCDSQVVQLLHNVASGGGVGVNATLPGLVENNVASGNSVAGFIITPGGDSGTVFQGNAATGNGGPGVIVIYDENTQEGPNSISFAKFMGNDFYGNDRNRPPLSLGRFGFNPGAGAHCGVLNVGAQVFLDPQPTTPTVAPLQAANNYWGSTSGPAATGPGDTAGGVCDQNGGATTVKPFSASWFSFVPLAW
jgi:hypothetical protein